MVENSNIINWENVLAQSKTFQDQKPVKWAFLEEFFVRDFYEKLYETYPKKDKSWSFESSDDKSAYRKWWGDKQSAHIPTDIEDTNFSESWNEFYHYMFSNEFISNFRKFSDVPVSKLKGFGFMLLFGFFLVFIIQRKGWNITEVNPGFLFFMLIESVLWSVGLFWIMNFSNQIVLMNPNTRFLIQKVVLSIGAGIYEEFVFRLLFIGGFTYLIGFVLQWREWSRKFGAVVVSAVIFSLFHFIGILGDQPDLGLFLIRFVAGLFLGILFCFRGFGITASTHALYDLILLVMVVT